MRCERRCELKTKANTYGTKHAFRRPGKTSKKLPPKALSSRDTPRRARRTMGSDAQSPAADASCQQQMTMPQLAIAGGASGLVARFATHPFDTLKTQMQVQGAVGGGLGVETNRGGAASTSASTSTYRGVFDTAKTLVRRDGVVGFYRGFSAVVAGIPFASAAYFAGYEAAKVATKKVQDVFPETDAPRTSCERVLTRTLHDPSVSYVTRGILAQSLAGIVFTPIDVVKERLQAKGVLGKAGAGAYGNLWEGCRTILKKEGPRGFFRGYWASNFTWWPWSIAYFVTYEHMRDGLVSMDAERRSHRASAGFGKEPPAFEKTKDALPPWVSGGCGFAAASLATAVTHPLDLAKTRLQTLRVEGRSAVSGGTRASKVSGSNLSEGSAIRARTSLLPRDASVFSIARGVLRREGARALFAGCTARVLAVAPGSALSFYAYESIKVYFTTAREEADD